MRRIKVAEYSYNEKEIEAVRQVFNSGWLVHHDAGSQFEEEFANTHGVDFAVSVCNATEGLAMAVRRLGAGRRGILGPQREVLCPALTYIATVNCVSRSGFVPVLYDVKGQHDLGIDIESLDREISDNTIGVVVMHYGGHISPDIAAVADICERSGMFLIEDCAHAPLSRRYDCHAGTFGDAGVFSFHGTKTLAIGEGGMVVTNHGDLASQLKTDRLAGRYRLDKSYDVLSVSGKSCMTEYQSAIGLVQLAKLSSFKTKLQRLAITYTNELRNDVVVPFERDYLERDFTPYNFTVLLPEGADRRAVVNDLEEVNIETTIEYTPIYDLQVYKGSITGEWSKLEKLKTRILTLPLNVCMALSDVYRVCEALKKAIKCRS